MKFEPNEMGFDPSDYVQRDGPEDRYNAGPALIVACRCCGRPLLTRPDEEPDCGMHLN
jgi:hypothetical protein